MSRGRAFPFVGDAYRARSLKFDAQRTVNLYPELGNPTGTSRSVAALYGTPGLVRWKTLTGGGVRGLWRFNATLRIAVCGENVWRLNAVTGVDDVIGTIQPGSTPVSMDDNGAIIMLVTGSAGYFISPVAGTVTAITDPDFVGGDRVGFLAGRFVWNKPGTGQYQWASLYGTDIDGLAFSTSEDSPDITVSQMVGFGELWQFGEKTTQIFSPGSDAARPFVPVQGASMEIGCEAKHSPSKIDNTFFWLGKTAEGGRIVWKATGFTPQRISTHALEFALAQYSRVDDAIGFTYQQEGHSFYVLVFPTASKTWAFDTTTGMWHERAWRDPATGNLERIRPQCQGNFDLAEPIVGDWENPYLYRWSLDAYTDDGGILPAIRQCPHMHADGRRQFFDCIELMMETGVGLSSGQGSAPMLLLEWSDDGGKTWSTDVREVPIGAIGEYGVRARETRLGSSFDRVFRVTITDPVERAIVGATVSVKVGT